MKTCINTFACDVCSKKFTRKRNMIRHKKEKHFNISFQDQFEKSLIGHKVLKEKVHNTPNPTSQNTNAKIKNVNSVNLNKRFDDEDQDIENCDNKSNNDNDNQSQVEDVLSAMKTPSDKQAIVKVLTNLRTI